MAIYSRDKSLLSLLPKGKKRRSALRHPIEIQKGLTVWLTEEGMEQYKVAEWLRAHNIWFIHIPNEAKRHRLEAITLKLLGLEPGASDIIIFDTPAEYPGFRGTMLEMKSKRGKLTESQKGFLIKGEAHDWLTMIGMGAEHAIQQLKEVGYGKD